MRSVSSLHFTEDVSDAEEGASESASWCVRACRGQSPEAFLNLAVALQISIKDTTGRPATKCVQSSRAAVCSNGSLYIAVIASILRHHNSRIKIKVS